MVDIYPIMVVTDLGYGGYEGGYPPVVHIQPENGTKAATGTDHRLARVALQQQSERLLSIRQKVSRRLDTSCS